MHGGRVTMRGADCEKCGIRRVSIAYPSRIHQLPLTRRSSFFILILDGQGAERRGQKGGWSGLTLFWLGGAAAVLACLLHKAHRNTHKMAFNEVVCGPVAAEDPDCLTVLHISDMHLEHLSITPDRLRRSLAGKKIDLVALTGDFMDRKSSIPKLAPYLQALNDLAPRYGIYAVFGNHDYALKDRHLARLKRLLNNYGCKVLQNDNDSFVVRGKRINVIGIDDFSTKRSDLQRSYRNIEDGFNLVLTHDPNVVLYMNGYAADYMLAGHFHGGQIHWPKPFHLAFMGELVRMNKVKGLHSYGGKKFYISEGLGQTGLNIRIGSRPEITLHRIALNTEAKTEQIGSASEAV
jgi:hypothetical protein